jgi:hypothetical protein
VSILAFGGEMGFFIPSDVNAFESTISTHYNSTFARCQSRAQSSSSYLETPDVGTQADLWLHFDMNQNEFSNTATLTKTAELLDSGGVGQIRLTTNWQSGGSTGTWQLEHYNGSTWDSLGSITATPNARQTVDIHVVSNTSSGTVDLYLSGTHRIAGTVNLSGLTGIKKVRLWGKTDGLTVPVDYSQVVLATESTIGKRVGTIVMTGQGTTHTFTTGGFGNIDEAVYSDADIINSGTAAQEELFTGTPVPDFTSYVIRALAVTARVKKNGSGPTQCQLSLRSAGTTYHSATKALDFAYGNICNVWETNPATSAAFLSSEIAALQYGVLSVA